jgi:hypothetical protein
MLCQFTLYSVQSPSHFCNGPHSVSHLAVQPTSLFCCTILSSCFPTQAPHPPTHAARTATCLTWPARTPPVISHRAANLYTVSDATLFHFFNETTSVTQVSLCSEAHSDTSSLCSEAHSDTSSMEYEFLKPQVATECVSSLLHIWNVPGSNLDPETSYPACVFCCFLWSRHEENVWY